MNFRQTRLEEFKQFKKIVEFFVGTHEALERRYEEIIHNRPREKDSTFCE